MNYSAFEEYEALILDMDGTLIDSGQLHEKAWLSALDHFNIPVDRNLMRSLAGVPTRETIKTLVQHFNISSPPQPEQVQTYKDQQVKLHLFDYIKATALEGLVKHFYGQKPMAVGTGANTQSAHALLQACDLLPYFDFVVGADQVEAYKPAPDTFLRCAALLGTEPESCVVFEDSALGLEAAKRAGMHAIDVEKQLGIVNDYFL